MPTRAFMEEAISHLIGGRVEIARISKTDWYPPWKKAKGNIVNLTINSRGFLEIGVSDLRDERGCVIEGTPLEPNFLKIYLPGGVIRETRGWGRIISSHAYEWKLTPP